LNRNSKFKINNLKKVSKEKSQFENVTLSPVEGGAVKKNSGPTLPAGFALGKSLEQEQPVSRAESVKSFLPSYRSQEGIFKEEERKLRARLEKEGMNYDLYSLIKNKLAGEFESFLEGNGRNFSSSNIGMRVLYLAMKKSSSAEFISNNRELCTPTVQDLVFISKNLEEFFGGIKEEDHPRTGAFLNFFIHAYFDSIPKKERENLKLFLPGTKDLNFIGAKLSFGELEVEEAGDGFGLEAFGNTVLKAENVKNGAGQWAQGDAQVIVDKAENYFGKFAYGRAILKARKVKDCAGEMAKGNAQIIVKEAGHRFGFMANEHAVLKAKKVANNAGLEAFGNAQITVEEAGDFFGASAREHVVLRAGSAGIKVGYGATIREDQIIIGEDKKDSNREI
jgi:hypothetical protein